MRVLVCGGRKYTNSNHLFDYLDSLEITEIIHGGAPGADSLAGLWARLRKINCVTYPADWNTYGHRAGVIRNYEMLRQGKPDLVVAFPGGSGTQHMMSIARKEGVCVLDVNGDDFHPPRYLQMKLIDEEP